ncbi:MAG: hypothetical protein U1E60_31600 [Reyranellaceae bacterium]
MKDPVLEDGVEPLADPLLRLWHAVAFVTPRALVRLDADDGLEQFGRLDLCDRLVPDARGDVILERRDPLGRVLLGARVLDHSLVIVARAPG